MATRRRFKIGLQIDDRTSDMSTQALYCRRHGHKWNEKAMSRKRYLELIQLGQNEEVKYCENGCGATWRQTVRRQQW